MLDINSLDHELYYLRCMASLKECFDDPENAFLTDDLGRNLSEVNLVTDRIQIILNEEGRGFDTMEVLIRMCFNDSELGYYKQIYDNEGTIIDEMVVIHAWVKN